MPRVSLYTLGCKLNFAETSTISREFRKRSFDVVPFGEPADVTVINTCTVTEQAEQKCRNVVRRAVRDGQNPFIIVTGCYAQMRPHDIAAIEGVDLVLGNAEKTKLFDIARSFVGDEKTQIAVSCIDDVEKFGPAYAASERTRAFLKIQDGCDYSCSFCTIPMARGRSRSAPLTETVDQAEEIAAAGCKEIVLSGVNVGLYGREHGASLLELIMRLDEVAGVDRFRISSIEPNLLTDEIVDFVAASERFMPHFHVPLQSGDNRVLGTMRRRYRREAYADRVDYILDRMPHACIGADVIVGSPGESTDAFESTRDFIVDLPLAYLHVFTYSERPDTTAVQNVIDGTSDSVPRATRRERSRTLRLLSDRMRSTFYASQAGKERNVLWESANSDGSMYGYTDNYVRVQTEFDEQRTGSVELVTLGQETLNGCVNVADATIALPIIQQMQ